MKRWKSWLLIVALLTIGTLSLSQAQWNPDTTNFYPAKVIKEMFGVFEAIKVGTNLTNAEKAGSSTVVRGGKFVASNIDSPDIDGADIDGGTVDGVDLSATSADLNSPDIDGGTIDDVDLSASSADLDNPDIDGGTIDGSTIGSTVDIVEAEIRFDNRTSNPSGPSEGDAYWNSSVDSLRIYDGSSWRNVGQRGQGYYELTTYDYANDPTEVGFNASQGAIIAYRSGLRYYINGDGDFYSRLAGAVAVCRSFRDHDGFHSLLVSNPAGLSGGATYDRSEDIVYRSLISIGQVVNTFDFSRASDRRIVSTITCYDRYGQ